MGVEQGDDEVSSLPVVSRWVQEPADDPGVEFLGGPPARGDEIEGVQLLAFLGDDVPDVGEGFQEVWRMEGQARGLTLAGQGCFQLGYRRQCPVQQLAIRVYLGILDGHVGPPVKICGHESAGWRPRGCSVIISIVNAFSHFCKLDFTHFKRRSERGCNSCKRRR